MNFWTTLPKPFFALAPMADVTDPAFRLIIAKYGKPDVTWTEFVSADGLSHPEAREKLIKDLAYTESERPIVAQLFSSKPEKMREAARLCAELGFDGVDINMGCPDKSIEKQGAGAAMIKTPEIAASVIQAAKDGIKDAGKNIAVSVKTRVGYNKIQIDEWIPFLLSQDIAALTVHARTRKEMSAVPARWEHVKEVVEVRNKMGIETKIIGNGDVKNVTEGERLARETGCDGIMIGRAIFGNPWLFKGGDLEAVSTDEEERKYWLHQSSSIDPKEKLRVLVEHSKLFEELLGDVKSFAVMKKHFKAYVNGFDGAKELRMQLMEANSAKDVEQTIAGFLDPTS